MLEIKFDTACSACGVRILAGSSAEWNQGLPSGNGARCADCVRDQIFPVVNNLYPQECAACRHEVGAGLGSLTWEDVYKVDSLPPVWVHRVYRVWHLGGCPDGRSPLASGPNIH